MTTIYHLTTQDAWNAARTAGEYRAESLATEGFIHASTAEQVEASANRFFALETNLLLLELAPEQLKSPLRWEASSHSEHPFPHVYGPINVEAVVRVFAWARGSAGTFQWSPAMLSPVPPS